VEVKHEWQDGPELLTAKCDGDKAMAELAILEPLLELPEETGTAKREDGSAAKSNRGIFFGKVFTPLYADCSPTSLLIESFITSAENMSFTPNSCFQALYAKKGFDLLFSAYRDGDYYEHHRDVSKLTVLLWLGEKNFEGGDLYLTDFDYTVEYEPNKIFMFPSHYQHEVTKISTDHEGFVRYCASAFIN